MGWLDNLFRSVGSPEAGPSGERPGRGFGDVTAEGSGESYAEPEQQQQVIESARVEDTANLLRLMAEVTPRVTRHPSRQVFGSGPITVRGDGHAHLLLGADPERQRLWLWELTSEAAATERIWIGGSKEDARYVGFMMPSDYDGFMPLLLEYTGPLWVCVRSRYGTVSTRNTLMSYLVESGE